MLSHLKSYRKWEKHQKRTKICTFSLFWQWKWWKYIFWTKSIKSTQKMGSYGVKSFSVSFETKKLQAKQNFPWPFVHKLGIWATVAEGEVCTVYIFWVIGQPLIWGFIVKSVLWPLSLWFWKLRGLIYPQERPLHTKGEVWTVYICTCNWPTSWKTLACRSWSLYSVYLLSNWPASNLRFHS